MKNIIILAIAFLIGSCTIQKKSNVPKAKTISFESSACFGKCAAQNLTINKNLQMNYEGIKHVKNVGTFLTTITEEDYNKLLNDFEDAKFSEMNNTYLSSLRDIQKFTITLGKKSVTFHERSANTELKGLSDELQAIINKYNWKKN